MPQLKNHSGVDLGPEYTIRVARACLRCTPKLSVPLMHNSFLIMHVRDVRKKVEGRVST